MPDNVESVQVRLQHLVLYEPIALDDHVAWMVEHTLGQQRPELPAANLHVVAKGGEITNQIGIATEIQVQLPWEPPELRTTK